MIVRVSCMCGKIDIELYVLEIGQRLIVRMSWMCGKHDETLTHCADKLDVWKTGQRC